VRLTDVDAHLFAASATDARRGQNHRGPRGTPPQRARQLRAAWHA
jgi:hypothetical protein